MWNGNAKNPPDLQRLGSLPPDIAYGRARPGVALPPSESVALQELAVQPTLPPVYPTVLAAGAGLPVGAWIPPVDSETQPTARQLLVFTSILHKKRRKSRILRYKLASRFCALCVGIIRALAASIRKGAGRTRG